MAKDNQQQRFLFIELIAWWEGVITNKAITQQFGISRQQAYTDILAYHTQYPNNIAKAKHGYSVAKSFCAHFITGEVGEYLHWFTFRTFAETTKPHKDTELLFLPQRYVSEKIIRQLVHAIRNQQRLEVDYVSLSHPEREGRIFHPHTFVNSGLRWHIRGYCEKSQAYRDLVLSRFRGEPEILDGQYQSKMDDKAWQKHIEIRLKPDPRLAPAQQQVLASDYQMENGELIIKCRAALASYVLAEMKINTKFLDGTPEAQQLVVVNQTDIKPWLINS